MYFLTMDSGQSTTVIETCVAWSMATPFKARRTDALGDCADGNLLAVALAGPFWRLVLRRIFEQKGRIWHCPSERLNPAPVRR